VESRLWSAKVIEALADLIVLKGVPEHLRSDNGREFVMHDLRKRLADTRAKTIYIESGSPWENGFCESFNAKPRDEFLDAESSTPSKSCVCWPNRWRKALQHHQTSLFARKINCQR
jgi:putative transposase